jgi:hypothetical protein
MNKTTIKVVIGFALVVIFSWISIFGFLKKNYTLDWSKTTKATPSEINSFLSNPNLIPLWMPNFKNSRKVRDTAIQNRSIYLLEIEDAEESFQVIFVHDQNSTPDTIFQFYEHPFYNLKLTLLTPKDDTNKIQLLLNLEGEDFIHRILSPFFSLSILQEYKEKYDRAIDKINSKVLKSNDM